MSEPEPQATPEVVVGTEDGPSEIQPTPVVAETPEVVSDVAKELAELKEKNRELQYRLTQKGRELAEQRRSQSTPTKEESISPDVFFTDPVNVVRRVVTGALSEFAQEQEQRRQIDRMIEQVAEERGTTKAKLERSLEKFREASQDPYALLDMVAKIDAAENVSKHVQTATKAAVDTVVRNARAVTSQGASPQTPIEKSESEMTLEERRAKLIKMYGEAPANP